MARRTRGDGRPPVSRPWLELRGQQRLQRLHGRLQMRRQLLERWATAVDSAEKKVLDRLEELGGGESGYDAAGRDVSGRFRDRGDSQERDRGRTPERRRGR